MGVSGKVILVKGSQWAEGAKRHIKNCWDPQRLNKNAQSSISHDNQKVETTHMSINRWTENYLYNGILFSYEKEWSTDTYYIAWMNLENIMCFQNMKWCQACKAWFLLCDISRIDKSIDLGKPIETESRLEVTRDGGWGEWGVTALWVQGVFLMGWWNVLKLERIGVCTIL